MKQVKSKYKNPDRYITMLKNKLRLIMYPETDYRFGKTYGYKRGDIIFWRGNSPCIGKIKGGDGRDFIIDSVHNSLHYSNLRYAKPNEIKQLGNNKKLLIKDIK